MPAYSNIAVFNGMTPVEPLYGSPTYPSRVASPGPVLYAPAPEQRSVFFAGVTPVVTTETLMALFSQFGRCVHAPTALAVAVLARCAVPAL